MTYHGLYYTDIPEHAAFLLASGGVLESFYWAKDACVFVFEDENKCLKVVEDIRNDKYNVNTMALIKGLKTIYNIMHLNVLN